MSSITLGLLVFACTFGAVLLGMRMCAALPDHHLKEDTKDSVRIGMGLVATMTALLLGLLIASAKGSYDTAKSEVTQMAAKIVFLDRVLANYGPETAETRNLLRRSVERAVDRMWPDHKSQQSQLDPMASGAEFLYNSIQKLSPQNDVQRSLKSQAVEIATDLGQIRWLLFEQADRSISRAMLIVVIAWLAIIFFSIGLFSPVNSTVIAALMLSALSVSSSIFLLLELDQPFDGMIRISSESMLNVIRHLGQ